MLLTVATAVSHGQVKLIGKIDHYDGTSVVSYNSTIDSINTAYLYAQEVMPNRNGEFEIAFICAGIGTLRLSYEGLTYSFVHESSSSLYLRIDQKKIAFPKLSNFDRPRADHIRDSIKQAATVLIGGDLATLNVEYNKTLRSAARVFRVQGCDYSIFLSKLQSPDEVIAKVDSMIHKEIDAIARTQYEIESSRTQAKINPKVYNYFANQIKIFYWNTFLSAVMLKRKEQLQAFYDNHISDTLIYNKRWEMLIYSFLNDINLNIDLEPVSFESMEFLLNLDYALGSYHDYNPTPDPPDNDELVIDRLSDAYWERRQSPIKISSKMKFAFQLHNLTRFLSTPTYYSPSLLLNAEGMQRQNASSTHMTQLSKQLDALRTFLKKTSIDFHEAVFISINYLRFEDLLNQMVGDNIVVHLWATWCPPCFKDFEYNYKLSPFIEEGQIKVLYISLDEEDSEARWKDNVRFYKLRGYHILASDILIRDIWAKLSGVDGQIPRYVLIDKSGKIFMNDAPRLGNDTALADQIKIMIAAQQR